MVMGPLLKVMMQWCWWCLPNKRTLCTKLCTKVQATSGYTATLYSPPTAERQENGTLCDHPHPGGDRGTREGKDTYTYIYI